MVHITAAAGRWGIAGRHDFTLSAIGAHTAQSPAGKFEAMRAGSPREVAQALAEAISGGDAQGARELWSEDAIVIAPDGSQTVGREAIGRILEQLVASETTMRIELHTIHATQGTAVALGTLTLIAPSLEGGPPLISRGDSLVIYTRGSNGAWRISIDCPWGMPAPPT